jgi:hypothetical protein
MKTQVIVLHDMPPGSAKQGKVGYIDVFVEFPLENKNGVWL